MKAKILIVSLAALPLVAASCNNPFNKDSQQTTSTADTVQLVQDIMQTESNYGATASQTDNKQITANTEHGSYQDYSDSLIKAEHNQGNKVVLFFHAPWCPFCKAADLAFKANLKNIPAGVTILKTDYDSNSELKQKYGVTYQHTFVQVDSKGNLVSKWSGGDIENLKKYLQ